MKKRGPFHILSQAMENWPRIPCTLFSGAPRSRSPAMPIQGSWIAQGRLSRTLHSAAAYFGQAVRQDGDHHPGHACGPEPMSRLVASASSGQHVIDQPNRSATDHRRKRGCLCGYGCIDPRPCRTAAHQQSVENGEIALHQSCQIWYYCTVVGPVLAREFCPAGRDAGGLGAKE